MEAYGWLPHALPGALELLEEKSPRRYRLRFKKVNTRGVVQAIQLTPVGSDGRRSIEKSRKSERNNIFPQEHTTHFTNTLDLHMLYVGTAVVMNMPDVGGLLVV
ncbi:hypothetical protein ACFPAF_07105 [Hymenobacter endophyticus]|uniref:Uncharacterized protein n=1 Tax=Hymenobacter endophyticus TaxID=3076335 RepID=A0ABU3TFK7_9BACT|nr:hypothetical protein [Hymenobacter endophyticus]MDU0370152.1 hypothetical protein [Hymenobacter endophyticus]